MTGAMIGSGAAAARRRHRDGASLAIGLAVYVAPETFLKFVHAEPNQIVLVYVESGWLKKTTNWYQISHKGFLFYTGVYGDLDLPEQAELIAVRRLWLPHKLWR